MKIDVSIRHDDYPAQVRDSVEERLRGLGKFYTDRVVSLRALLQREGEQHRAELLAHVAQGPTLTCQARATSFAAALDEAIDRMSLLLTRAREKRSTERRRPGRASA